MTDSNSPRVLARAGILLVLLALLIGVAIGKFTNSRQALAAHISGVMNGLLLVAFSSLWRRLTLSAAQQRLAMSGAIGGVYINFVGSLLAAAWGTNRLTPMAGAGFGAASWQEAIVQVIQVSQAIALLTALSVVVYGLRRSRGSEGVAES